MKIKKENIRLSDIANGNPFSVPEGYFDHLSERVLDQVGTREKHGREISIHKIIRYSMEIAAGIAIILIMVVFPYRIFRPDTSNQPLSTSIDEEYFLTYSLDDRNIYETLESESPESSLDNKQLENVLLGSINEYELIVLNNSL